MKHSVVFFVPKMERPVHRWNATSRRGRGTLEPGVMFMEYTNSRMDSLIGEHIHSDRDRRILHRRLVDGICYDALAEEFDMSVRQIKTIVYRAQAVLFRFV